MEKLTRHHVIAKHIGGSWHKDNLVMLPRNIHDSVHELFGNNLPLQIIRQILDRYEMTMNIDTYKEIDTALKKVEDNIWAYNPNCFDPDILSLHIGKSKSQTS